MSDLDLVLMGIVEEIYSYTVGVVTMQVKEGYVAFLLFSAN